MLWLTLNRRARSACVAVPSASAFSASRFWCGVSFGGRPIWTPRALARIAAFAGAGADQLALELGKAAEHGQHQAPVRRRGVRPCVAERAETGSGLRYRVEDVQEVAGRSRQPVEARDKQGVACVKGV